MGWAVLCLLACVQAMEWGISKLLVFSLLSTCIDPGIVSLRYIALGGVFI